MFWRVFLGAIALGLFAWTLHKLLRMLIKANMENRAEKE